MSQSAITLAFERWKASATEAQQPVILDEFVLANVPNLDPSKPIDRNEGLPDVKYIMHRQAVNKTGVVNQNAVAYSVTIGAEIGDFDFNWIGLLNKQSGTVAMIVHAPTQRKIKTQAGQQGNVLTRSFLLEYLGASKETAITTPAEMWQIDFTARLTGMDEMQRLINRDKYGVASFFNNGFLVAKAGNQFYVTRGLGYIEGLRAELPENKNITVTNQATKVWVDVSYQGNITSDWDVHIAITVKPDLKNYTDNAHFPHFVFAVASISATGVITDLRPKGTLDAQYFDEALKKHEQSRNHPDATTSAKGFTKLDNNVGDSKITALTPYGAKKELENYQPAGNYVTTATFNLEINKKIDKANIAQQLANDANKVPSLDLVTKELGKKQPAGNYADKASSDSQRFNGQLVSDNGVFVRDRNNVDTYFGLLGATQGKPFGFYCSYGGVSSVITLPEKMSGTIALVGSSYTKLESNNRYQMKGDYQPAGEYSLVGDSYTKKESDNKYQPVGNYADKLSNESQRFSAQVISHNGIYCSDKINPTNYFGLLRAERGNPYGFYLAYDNSGYSIKFPEKKGGTLMLVGDYGFGDSLSGNIVNPFSYQSASQIFSSDAIAGLPWGFGFMFAHRSSAIKMSASLYTGGSNNRGDIWIVKSNDGDGVAHKLYTDINTYIDRNGCLKAQGYDDLSDYPVGSPIPWPQSSAPSGFLICQGQAFNKTTYPKLAIAYPSGRLPEMRSEFIRGLDSGRGVDNGRVVLSAQSGNSLLSTNLFNNDSPVAKEYQQKVDWIGSTGTNNQGGYGIHQQIEGQNGNETRPRNIAFLYIVRAA